MKKVLSLLLLALLLAGLFAVASADQSGLTISMNSATITIGSSQKLSIKYNGTKVSADAWVSSDTSVAKVSSSGKVTGKAAGSATIYALYNGQTVECLVSVVRQIASENVRYNVLVVDTSGSIRGTPLLREKEAAKRFAKAVLSADGENKVAVVTMGSSSSILCGMTDNYSLIASKIDGVTASGDTNMTAAFRNADKILSALPSGEHVFKNMVLCSDGLPNLGEKLNNGKYSAENHRWYNYANATYSVDKKMKQKGFFIYALGFFHNSTGNDLVFGKQLMKDLASKDKNYVTVNPDDIDDVMDDIVEVITDVTLNETTIMIPVGGTYQLTAYLNGQQTDAEWTSSSKSIATVNQKGKVTGKKAGTTKVTATVGGVKATCTVKVYELSLPEELELYVGESKTLTLTKKGITGTAEWTSADSTIASVNNSGKVTGVKVGKTTVTATVQGIAARCTVTVKARQEKSYTFKGKITNAMNGDPLKGVAVAFRSGNDNTSGTVVKSTKTKEDGTFSVKIPAGNYTVTMSKSGFITGSENVVVQKKACKPEENINYLLASLSPSVGSGNFRIVLTWGTTCRDLDSHFTGPVSGSNYRFHVMYSNKNAYNNGELVANLDLDDRDYEGPETTTFYYNKGESGTYNFYVYQYSSDATPLCKPGARVVVYRGDKQLASYAISTNASTTSRLWKVFSITDGKLKYINQMLSEYNIE